MINDQQLAYDETGNEKVLKVLRQLEAKRDAARENELAFSEEDFQDILNNPSLYPHAVRTWAFDYRDDEIS